VMLCQLDSNCSRGSPPSAKRSCRPRARRSRVRPDP
jgi:hypothetical protein